ncbi:hypothetical protein QUF74_19115 [Candidatus Halobeggiatoa sp. HSG11]|nr:hypothetical protein [Candidatus Halobeggiatoa sp. HSG11]
MKLTYLLFVTLFIVFNVQAADKLPTSEASAAPPVVSEEKKSEEPGKELHNSECVSSCHTPKLYTSENRKVKDFAHLNTFVQMCATNLDKSWFEEDVADVANYLNTEYYKFSVEEK